MCLEPLMCAQDLWTQPVIKCRTQICGFLSQLDLNWNPLSARTSCVTLDKPLNFQGLTFLSCQVGDVIVLLPRVVRIQ